MEFESHTLKNGLRIIHKSVPNLIAHCGIMINAGSRDELEHEHGLAHFIEHVLFKGTQKRKAHHILNRIEDVGGEINAYTTKEETCIYASFLPGYYDRSLELLSDIIFHSSFPDNELEREKEIIYDEINSYKDSPSELIFDEFEELLFEGNPIGRNILGTKKHLKKFSKKEIFEFFDRNYTTDQMVITSVGNIKFEKLVKAIEKYFEVEPQNAQKKAPEREKFNTYKSTYVEKKKRTYQTHCIIGTPAYSLIDQNRLGLYLLNNLLGGPGLSSRLNMTLREKNGISYNSESAYTPYSDTGIFNVYFGTNKENLNKSITLVKKEFKKLQDAELSKFQLAKAKRQLLGQMAISSENHENLMLNMGKSFMVYDKVDSFQEITDKIQSITSLQLQEISNEIFNPQQLSYLIYY